MVIGLSSFNGSERNFLLLFERSPSDSFTLGFSIVSVQMVKRETGDPSIYDDYQVDGLSGATMTANGVNDMLKNYFTYYRSYFQKVQTEGQDAGEENINQETGGDEFSTDPESN